MTASTGLLEHGRMSIKWVLVRLVAYAILIGGLFQTLVSYQSHLRGKQILSEGGTVEDAQLAVLATIALLLFWSAVKCLSIRWLAFFLVALTTMAILRESDNVLERELGKGAWSTSVLTVAAITICAGWWKRRELSKGAARIVGSAAYGYLASGFIIVMVVSRLLGQQVFWRSINPNKYTRDTPRTVEELVELAGYLLLLCGALELLLLCRRLHPVLTRATVGAEPNSPS